MGSGKSSIGRLVAGRLGFRFLDTDALIVQGAGMEIAGIFEREGEERFRDRETEVLESIGERRHCVVATGGGTVLRERNRELLRDLGLVVLLTASEEVIFDRVSRNSRRPLLQTENPRATISRLLENRRAAYEAAAHWALDTSVLSHAQAADAVIAEARRAFAWQDSG